MDGLQGPRRERLVLDLFHGGLPEVLAALLELESPPWLMLNVPVEMLSAQPGGHLPSTIDLIGGRLVPRPGADLSSCERSAHFHFGGDDQKVQRGRLATELALSRGLLVPDLMSMFALQVHLPCQLRTARHLARSLMDLGFARAVIIVGSDSTEASGNNDGHVNVRSHVKDEDGELRLVVDGVSQGTVSLRAGRTSERLRSRLAHLVSTMHLPRRLPVVIDFGAHNDEG